MPLLTILGGGGGSDVIIPGKKPMLDTGQNVGPIVRAEGLLRGIPAEFGGKVQGQPGAGRSKPLFDLKVIVPPGDSGRCRIPGPEGLLDLRQADDVHKIGGDAPPVLGTSPRPGTCAGSLFLRRLPLQARHAGKIQVVSTRGLCTSLRTRLRS